MTRRINAWMGPAAGTVLGWAAIIAYIVAANAVGHGGYGGYGDRDSTANLFKVLSVMALAIFVISPPGLAYVVSRTTEARVLAPVIAGTLVVALLAYPALYLLSVAYQCNIGDSFPIPNVVACS